MSNTLTFHNPGHLDPAAFKYMGLSVKSEGSFGQFGTGLKYAIATILRNGGNIEIHTGGRRYFFELGRLEFRGKTFQPIFCNGQELGITTELGKNWEPWMAYRELYCNARDEGGTVSVGTLKNKQDTMIVVTCAVLANAHATRHKYFIDPCRVPIDSTQKLQIFSEINNNIYYQGVKVYEANTLFTYNILDKIKLNEDRTVAQAWELRYLLSTLISESNDVEVIEKVLTCKDSTFFEFYLSYAYATTPSSAFIYVCESLYKEKRIIPQGFKSYLQANRPDLFKPKQIDASPSQQVMLNRAITFLKQGGYDVDNYPIEVIESAGDSLMGTGYKKICLTEAAFTRGVFELACTILEEYFHVKTGYSDFTREFQDYLFRELVTSLQHEENLI